MNNREQDKNNRKPISRIEGPIDADMEAELQYYVPIAWCFIKNMLWNGCLDDNEKSYATAQIRKYLAESGSVMYATMELCARALMTEYHFKEHAMHYEQIPQPNDWFRPDIPLGGGNPSAWRKSIGALFKIWRSVLPSINSVTR